MRTWSSPGALLTVVAAVLLGRAVPSGAEWFVDLTGGASFTDDANLSVSGVDNIGNTANLTLFDIRIDADFNVGLRGGYWFESAPYIGLAGSVSVFPVDLPKQTVAASAPFVGNLFGKPITFTPDGQAQIPKLQEPGVILSPMLMLRLPLVGDEDIPQGRVQPYALVGPAWLLTDDSPLSAAVGFQVGGGLAWQFHPNLALLAEYRYSEFSVTIKDQSLRYETKVKSHHLMAGISFRF